MKRLLFVLLAVMGAVACFAPLIDRPNGSSFYQEGSDAERAKSQTSAVANSVEPIRGYDDEQPKTGGRHDEDAAKTMISASNAAKAADSLKTANSDLKGTSKSNGGGSILLGLMIAILGIGALFGFRTYLDKVAGEPMDFRKK